MVSLVDCQPSLLGAKSASNLKKNSSNISSQSPQLIFITVSITAIPKAIPPDESLECFNLKKVLHSEAFGGCGKTDISPYYVYIKN